jgi:Predicted transcriptional regulator
MDEPRWLDEREQRAWRSLMKMQAGLSEYIERQLRTHSGLSTADYQVLAHLSEAPEGRLRSFALGDALQWEKSRLSQHLTRMQNRNLIRRERCATDQQGPSWSSPNRAAPSSRQPPHSTWLTCAMC